MNKLWLIPLSDRQPRLPWRIPEMRAGMLTGMSISPPGFPNRLYLSGWTVPHASSVVLTAGGESFTLPVKLTDPPYAGTFLWVIPERLEDGVTHPVVGEVFDALGRSLGPVDNADLYGRTYNLQIPS